ncbi:MAG: hypothetical protein ACJ74Z_23260 [Bryobacteraceae bacterium]
MDVRTPWHLDGDFYRCASSLQSELAIVKRLLELAKRSLCPKLKTYAPDLEERKLKLIAELNIRAEEESIPVDFCKSAATFGMTGRFKRA